MESFYSSIRSECSEWSRFLQLLRHWSGLMGMEALETVIGYWEDALAAYNPTGSYGSMFIQIKISTTFCVIR